ncbi:MAG: HlyD family efflux transporter periplasmic adaptor subunit [Bryobacterales bacterium]|nr:HlyD family efflux transporter periplasmic adaptor subunit [Bryobacterales bacterium]
MTKLLLRIAIVFVAGALAAGGYFVWQSLPEDEQRFALADVQRGDLVVKTYLRGELRAVRSLTLTAPNIGTQSQITQLAPMGALAQRGDLIFELDDSERVAALEDSLLTVEQIQENLKKAEAELEIRKSQDEVEIVQANFQVRRAELEVQRNELLADIDARKNELTLEEARRRKQKLEADIENRLKQRESELAVLREQLNKAQLDVDRDERRIAQSRVLAPLTGLVAILQNRSGGRGGFGQSLPEIREGDQIPAGMSVAQLLDLSEMELLTRVEESERANLREGQEVLIRMDAIPDKSVTGTIKRLGNTASANIFSGEAVKKFECVIGIDMEGLLENIGAEPERIERIMATARQNASVGYGAQRGNAASRAPRNNAAAAPAGGGQGQRAGGNRGAQAGGPGQGQRAAGNRGGQAGEPGQGQARARQQAENAGPGGGQRGERQQRQRPGNEQQGERGQRGGAQAQQGGQGQQRGQRGGQGFDPSRILSRLPEASRKQAEDLLKGRSPQELSNEERQQFRQIMQAAAGGGRQGGGGGRQGGGFGGPGGGGFGGPGGGLGGQPGGFGAAGGGFGGQGGGAGGAGGGGRGGRQPQTATAASSGSEFSEAERSGAQLPEPPQQGSDVEVLLRPGLLADAEVTVERIPDTLYIPYQAVFEEGAQNIVYVLESGRLQPRRVQLGRRSESQVAITGGLAEGEQVSLYRPDSAPAPQTDSPESSTGPAFPGG